MRGVNDDCKDFAWATGQIEFPSTMGAGGAVDGRILKTKVKRAVHTCLGWDGYVLVPLVVFPYIYKIQ